MQSVVTDMVNHGNESRISVATVTCVRADEVVVSIPDGVDDVTLPCSLLHTTDAPLTLAEGDFVVCLRVRPDRGIVLGRVGPPGISTASGELNRMPKEVPEELLIEARKSLTLRVGDGSITIREDGRILIKGKDLVSHAKRMNRIRGGSVEIN